MWKKREIRQNRAPKETYEEQNLETLEGVLDKAIPALGTGTHGNDSSGDDSLAVSSNTLETVAKGVRLEIKSTSGNSVLGDLGEAD
jgi:hypothetical protein